MPALRALEEAEDVLQAVCDSSSTAKANHGTKVQNRVRLPVWRDGSEHVERTLGFKTIHTPQRGSMHRGL